MPDWGALAQPPREYVFDQRAQWEPPPVAWSRRRPANPRIRCARAPSSDAASSPGTFPDTAVYSPSLPVGSRRALGTIFPGVLLSPPTSVAVRLDLLSLSLGSPEATEMLIPDVGGRAVDSCATIQSGPSRPGDLRRQNLRATGPAINPEGRRDMDADDIEATIRLIWRAWGFMLVASLGLVIAEPYE